MAPSSVIPRFVVGMPRSATTWLCRSLNEHRDVAAFGETLFWGKGFIPPTAAGHYTKAQLARVGGSLAGRPFESTLGVGGRGAMRLSRGNLTSVIERACGALEPGATPGESFLSIMSAIAQAEGKTHWVEKTPHHLLHAARILRQLPDARFVVTLREPYGFMLSYKHQPGHDNSDASARYFRRRYHPLGCALVWRSSLRAAHRLLREHRAQVKLLDLSEIEKNPVSTLRRVVRFFLLPEDSSLTGVPGRVRTSFPVGHAPRLSSADVTWMNFVAGNDMMAAGYEKKEAPFELDGLARSALRLPLWGGRILKDLHARTDSSMLRYASQWIVRNKAD